MMRGMKGYLTAMITVLVVLVLCGFLVLVGLTNPGGAPTPVGSPQTGHWVPSKLEMALGDQPGAPDGTHHTSVVCAARSGRMRSRRVFNRVCYKWVYDGGLCYEGTGVTVDRLFVRLTGKRYKVLWRVQVGLHETCVPPEPL
jgi:hypothetical protein